MEMTINDAPDSGRVETASDLEARVASLLEAKMAELRESLTARELDEKNEEVARLEAELRDTRNALEVAKAERDAAYAQRDEWRAKAEKIAEDMVAVETEDEDVETDAVVEILPPDLEATDVVMRRNIGFFE